MPKLSEDAITSAKVTIGVALDNPTYQELPDDLSRAARIKVDFNLPASVVADHFQINKSKLARAVRSLEEGRAIGKMGRPTSLTEKGEQELLEAVKQIANQDQSTRPAFLSEANKILQNQIAITEPKPEKRKNVKVKPDQKLSYSYFQSFARRHPELQDVILDSPSKNSPKQIRQHERKRSQQDLQTLFSDPNNTKVKKCDLCHRFYMKDHRRCKSKKEDEEREQAEQVKQAEEMQQTEQMQQMEQTEQTGRSGQTEQNEQMHVSESHDTPIENEMIEEKFVIAKTSQPTTPLADENEFYEEKTQELF